MMSPFVLRGRGDREEEGQNGRNGRGKSRPYPSEFTRRASALFMRATALR